MLSRDTGDRDGMAMTLATLARDACGLGEYERAKQLYHESLALLQDIGHLSGMAIVLGDLSELGIVLGEYAEATQLAQDTKDYLKQLLGDVGDIRMNEDYVLALRDRERVSVTGPDALEVLRKYFSDSQIATCMSVSLSKLMNMHRRQKSASNPGDITADLMVAGAIKKTCYTVAEVLKVPKDTKKPKPKKENANGAPDEKSN